jgi:signal transduction histidine kinase
LTLKFSENAFNFQRETKENRKSRRERGTDHAATVLVWRWAHRIVQGQNSPARGLIWTLALILGFASSAAVAEGRDLIRSVDMLLDDSRTMSASAVMAQPMTPIGPSVSTGFTRAVLWLKITIDPPVSGVETVLKVFPNVLDDLTLYQMDAAGHLMAPQRAGNMLPLAQRNSPSMITHDFMLPATHESQTYLLRIETSSGALIQLTALAAEDAAAEALTEVLIGSFTMAVKLFSVILLALYGSYLPRRINLLFAATIACFGFVPFARLGYLQAAFVNVSPDVISLITSVSITVGICVLLFFLRLFLTPFAPHRLTLVLANALILMSFMGLPALWFDRQQLATMIAAASFALVAPVTGLMLVTLRRDAYIGRGTVRIICGTFSGLIVLFVLTTFIMEKAGPLYRFSIEFVGISTSTLIFALILMLNRSIKRRRQVAELRSLELRLESEALSRTRRFQKRLIDTIAEQSQRTATEIRGLIAAEPPQGGIPVILNKVMGRIEKIIEHCRQAGRIEQGEWRVDLAAVDLDEVLADLAMDIAPDRIQISTPKHLVARCDRNLIEVALGHLVSNASRYSVPKSPILVQARVVEKEMIQITISNDLPAGSQLDPDRLFEKFYRGVHSTSISGTGLGLFIAREILLTLSGAIEARCENGAIHFVVTLPQEPGAR